MDIEERLNEFKAADFIGFSVFTLRKDRSRPEETRLYIPYRKIGKRVLYRRGDLIEWLGACRT